MLKALTDGTTESFWEGRVEGGKAPSIRFAFEKGCTVQTLEVHIDNGRDKVLNPNNTRAPAHPTPPLNPTQRDKDHTVSELKLATGISEKFVTVQETVQVPSEYQGWVALRPTEPLEGPGVAVIHVQGAQRGRNSVTNSVTNGHTL